MLHDSNDKNFTDLTDINLELPTKYYLSYIVAYDQIKDTRMKATI